MKSLLRVLPILLPVLRKASGGGRGMRLARLVVSSGAAAAVGKRLLQKRQPQWHDVDPPRPE